MRRLLEAAGAVVAGFSLLAGAALAEPLAPAPDAVPPTITYTRPISFTPPMTEHVDSGELARMASAGATIPFWVGQARSGLDGRTYLFDMIGSSPFNTPASTTISYVPIVIKMQFPGGVVLDPTKPACNDNASVVKRLFGSPLFVPVHTISNGVDVGTVQLTDAFQRANFWSSIHGSPNYHVKLAAAASPIVVSINAPAGSVRGAAKGACHGVGYVTFSAIDQIARTLTNRYVKTNQLAVIVLYDVIVALGGQSLAAGYHFAYKRNGIPQTYAVGNYTEPLNGDTSQQDIDTWSHELGEWADDPFVSMDNRNLTPPWGPSCQGNLEVGDPLHDVAYYASINGFRYHPQDLANLAWFYRFPSISTGGRYSFQGAFRSAPGACR